MSDAEISATTDLAINDSNHQLIIIAGATASGKNQLALRLAQHVAITIINGDAMQLYRGLPILTAQPSGDEKAQTPHLLYGINDIHEKYSVARWLEIVQQAIGQARDNHTIPVIVGGSSMYLDRLLNGITIIPEIPDNIKQQAETLRAQKGNLALYELLADDDRQRLHVNDSHRIIRSYCVYQATGQSLLWWQKNHHQDSIAPESLTKIALMPARDVLYQRCNQRLLQMIENGALEEIRAILDEDDSLPACQAIGVKPLKSYLRGEIGRDEAVERAQQQTRNYAKRQYSWLNNHYHADRIISDELTEVDFIAMARKMLAEKP
ncbi:MAG: tRNA (adenosine(37)-N6)-dimethylallyltransferase MiaA [Alphaproteobacteria bacterium]|nr:tRNA (adenosine(37)-N6)-dimethylallyltransferase MiaA [Alphaproteobacteria bacterium]